MAFRTFDVGPVRGLAKAAAVALPNLVVIAGPNGAGKSTLLEELHREISAPETGTQVLWIGPHRGWDQVPIQRDVLWQHQGPLEPLLESLRQSVQPGMQVGWQLGTVLKTYLIRMLARQRIARDRMLDQLGPDDRIKRTDLPDLFAPFAELISTVLPYLRFQGVTENESGNSVQCLFATVDGTGDAFDIELLSSGEKTMIALFLPFLETRAQAQAEPATDSSAPAVPLTVLIDEVDQHLHPLLQLQVLQYLRDQARSGVAQFIVTTHSPALLDAATDDELFLLSPAALCPGGNQLTRLATSHDRLEAARELTGSTHLLTRAKPIVFVEGEPDGRRGVSDVHLISQLLPQTATWALVPTHSKTQVVKAIRSLRHEDLNLPGTPVFGLVDGDRDKDTGDDHVVAWPVAMIENLLLDTEAIYQALLPHRAETAVLTVGAVQDALERAVNDRMEDEVRLRIDQHLTHGYLRVTASDLKRLDAVAVEQAQAWVAKLRKQDLPRLASAARGEVDEIVKTGTQLDRFHGKKILRAVYRELAVDGRPGWATFTTAIARHAADRDRTRELTAAALLRITLYFPNGLAEALRTAGGPIEEAASLANECETHLAAWCSALNGAGGGPIADGRDDLRRRIVSFTRHDDVDAEHRGRLVRLAAEIGTP
ncbi:AAA family ATPase [Nakamurella sp.]|uniref:AAA family ATPase n=1 Tax=Nakamurella sp. TaxID=1869182 RepID=UPI003B3B41A3